MKDAIHYKGYTINIEQDDDIPMNPFEDWDCEPEILVYVGDDTMTSYRNAAQGHFDITEACALIPLARLHNAERCDLMRELGIDLRDFVEYCYGVCDTPQKGERLREQIDFYLCEKYSSPRWTWSNSGDYFDCLERILRASGTKYHSTTTDGSRVLAVATPTWIELPEHRMTATKGNATQPQNYGSNGHTPTRLRMRYLISTLMPLAR